MNEYVEYKSSLCSLQGLLGLGCIHLLNHEELMPYMTKILSKINERLILEDKNSFEENIRLFIEYYETELDKILEGSEIDEVIEDYGFSREVEGFSLRHFLISWENIYSTVYLQEMYNYSHLFTDSPIDCHECCGDVTEDEDGNLVYTPGENNLSSKYMCGCGK